MPLSRSEVKDDNREHLVTDRTSVCEIEGECGILFIYILFAYCVCQSVHNKMKFLVTSKGVKLPILLN